MRVEVAPEVITQMLASRDCCSAGSCAHSSHRNVARGQATEASRGRAGEREGRVDFFLLRVAHLAAAYCTMFGGPSLTVSDALRDDCKLAAKVGCGSSAVEVGLWTLRQRDCGKGAEQCQAVAGQAEEVWTQGHWKAQAGQQAAGRACHRAIANYDDGRAAGNARRPRTASCGSRNVRAALTKSRAQAVRGRILRRHARRHRPTAASRPTGDRTGPSQRLDHEHVRRERPGIGQSETCSTTRSSKLRGAKPR